jgi:hypothetical protein
MNQKELRALIRERMRNGQLPPVFSGKTFAGRGCNTACDCCGQLIGRHEVVYEVEFTLPCTESGRGLIAHPQCHEIWWEESGPQGNPPGSPGSRSLIWSALTDSLKRVGRSLN